MEKFVSGRLINSHTKLCCLTSITASFWGLVLYSYFIALRSPSTIIDPTALTTSSSWSSTPMINNNNLISISCSNTSQANKKPNYPFIQALRTSENKTDPCGGRYIYVHNLPSRFNEDIIKQCINLNPWTDMCKFISNAGMGPLLNESTVFSKTGWYATNQFALDLIFNRRMNQYQCLTNNSSLAAAIFVPFFAGFDIARHLWGHNISVRDSSSFDLINWLNHTPEWKIMDGKDHFMVAGRTTWDMRRLTDEDTNWGNKLLRLSAIRNMTTLVIESSPWHNNDYAIPYPTYFHPQKDDDIFTWQKRMGRMKREFLFSFAGAPRPGDSNSIRNHIINQCRNSNSCKLLECSVEDQSNCHSPTSVMNMFQTSHFCLQPQGDSYTRRSAFDSMLAGCIPVFFHPGSAYVQYTWHLPMNFTTYSVFISEDEVRKENSIEDKLKRIPIEQVKVMRENVINLVPNLVYADPTSKLETLKDAFDVAVQGVIDKVTNLRWDIINGVQHDTDDEDDSWKYGLSEKGIGPHEWDHYFSRPKEERRGD